MIHFKTERQPLTTKDLAFRFLRKADLLLNEHQIQKEKKISYTLF